MDDRRDLYAAGQLYDLAMDPYASGDQLDFFRRQILAYGQPVLELASGTGRLAIPLAEQGFDLTGLDLSPDMLGLAMRKAAERQVAIPWIQGDMRDFDLGRRFKLIIIAAQSLAHLHALADLEACFASVRRHLDEDGRLVLELFNPSFAFLGREAGRYPVGAGVFVKPDGGIVRVSEETRYDSAAQVNDLAWFCEDESSGATTVLTFQMRQFFPQEIDALLAYNGLAIEHKYGDFAGSQFGGHSPKQMIICRAARP